MKPAGIFRLPQTRRARTKKFMDQYNRAVSEIYAEKGTPTQVIRRAPVNVERVWAKRPRGKLIRLSHELTETRGAVGSRRTIKGEKMKIHTHLSVGGKLSNPLPSVADLGNFYRERKNLRVSVIAAKDKMNKGVSEVMGYTFIKRKKGTKAFLNQWELSKIKTSRNIKPLAKKFPAIAKYAKATTRREFINKDGTLNEKLFRERFIAAQREVEKAGFKLRFVPNKNAGYSWDGSRFVKR